MCWDDKRITCVPRWSIWTIILGNIFSKRRIMRIMLCMYCWKYGDVSVCLHKYTYISYKRLRLCFTKPSTSFTKKRRPTWWIWMLILQWWVPICRPRQTLGLQSCPHVPLPGSLVELYWRSCFVLKSYLLTDQALQQEEKTIQISLSLHGCLQNIPTWRTVI